MGLRGHQGVCHRGTSSCSWRLRATSSATVTRTSAAIAPSGTPAPSTAAPSHGGVAVGSRPAALRHQLRVEGPRQHRPRRHPGGGRGVTARHAQPVVRPIVRQRRRDAADDAWLRGHHLGRQVHPRPGDDACRRPRTAASWSTAPTFDVKVTLKPNLKWSDGTPLTMDDYVATCKWAIDPRRRPAANGCAVGWPDIGSIDESTDQPDGDDPLQGPVLRLAGLPDQRPLAGRTCASVAVAQASSCIPSATAIASVPVNGPFTITNASEDRDRLRAESVLDRRREHSPRAVPGGPQVRLLRLQGRRDSATSWPASSTSRWGSARPTTRPWPASTPAVGRPSRRRRGSTNTSTSTTTPTHSRGQDLWDPAVRKALAMAVDKRDLVNVLMPGQPVSAGLLAGAARPLVRRRRDLPGL